MKTIIILALSVISSFGQLTNLGKLTINTSLVWDGPKNGEDVIGYYAYVYDVGATNARYRIPTITNGIPAEKLIGTNQPLGDKWVNVTAVGSTGLESLKSATVAVTFVNTNQFIVSNIQFFMTAIATNLVPLKQIQLPPIP